MKNAGFEGRRISLIPHLELARPKRFELLTFWFVARRSIQLSYGRMGTRIIGGQPGGGKEESGLSGTRNPRYPASRA
jgi:hypothetical protein